MRRLLIVLAAAAVLPVLALALAPAASAAPARQAAPAHLASSSPPSKHPGTPTIGASPGGFVGEKLRTS